MKKENSRIYRLDFKLWKEYLEITQQFWLPPELYGIPRFVALLVMMLLFVTSLLFIFVVGTVCFANYLNPEFVASYAPGLHPWIQGLLRSWVAYFFAAVFIIPFAVYASYARKIRPFMVAWMVLATLVLLSFTVSGLNVVISYVSRFFQTALAGKDEATFWRFTALYFSVFVVGTPIVVLYTYIRQRLSLFWRGWITRKFIGHYFERRAYYELTANKVIDNPDQRMAEDLKQFTVTSLNFLLIILGAIIDLISFTGILWSISHLLSGILLAYAFTGTVVTVLIGRRLVGLNYKQLQKEADFRYGLIHIRDNAESIAFYQGEEKEKEQIGKRFAEVLKNFNFLIGWQRNLGFFTTAYSYLIIVLPSVIVAPMFFKGQIEFGQISQAGFAFSMVLTSFSIIVNNFEGISSFAAGINRVSTFNNCLLKASGSKEIVQDFYELEHLHEHRRTEIEREIAPSFAVREMTLKTPDYARTLVEALNFSLEDKDSILIVGHSGVGKSSLLRGIAGLWNSGSGKISHPPLRDVMFLPQRPYMVLGTFRDQMQYPHGRTLELGQIEEALRTVNLEEVYQKIRASLPEGSSIMDLEIKWDDVLSQGEQQRLAFARLILTRPKFAILDEATSALDVENERRLYEKLAHWGIGYISVGHRPNLKNYHQKVLRLEGDGKWSLHKASEFVF